MKKLRIGHLKVISFATTLGGEKSKTIKGGDTPMQTLHLKPCDFVYKQPSTISPYIEPQGLAARIQLEMDRARYPDDAFGPEVPDGLYLLFCAGRL